MRIANVLFANSRTGTPHGANGVDTLCTTVDRTPRQQFVDAIHPATARQLAQCYRDIREGIGDCKTPENYGAFPMDPYSHTPGQTGARQPGLTGQVKEDILCRFGELGVRGGRTCAERMQSFAAAPAVVATLGDQVDLLPQVLADVGAPQHAGLAVEGHPPDVAEGPYHRAR